jgi:hypothetical protein
MAQDGPESLRERRAARRWIALLASSTLALFVFGSWLAWRYVGSTKPFDLDAAVRDPGLRKELIERLVARSKGIFDTHPDPDVARVLQPGLENVGFEGTSVSSNEWGVREASYRLPKPPDVVRVVLLGDSYVFGYGAHANERMGVHLRQFLNQQALSFPGNVEVLHLAVGSWNAVSECEFARRQLSELAPDLLVQLLVTNDLDDNPGVRGFGARASFAPRTPERTDAMVSLTYPVEFTRKGNTNYLLEGVDWESRERYAELARHVERLARAVEANGGRYLLVAHWAGYKAKLRRFLGDGLREDQLLWLPDLFQTNKNLWVGPEDPHWNGAGHKLLAELLFGVIRGRSLLPVLQLKPWPAVERKADALEKDGHAQAHAEPPAAYWGPRRPVLGRLVFAPPTAESLRQVYTGIDQRGRVSPYAAVLLAGAAGRLVLRGRSLDRPELDGVEVAVFVDELQVGSFELRSGLKIDHAWPLPAELRGREHVAARFVTPDWVYAGDQGRHCVSFTLEELALAE